MRLNESQKRAIYNSIMSDVSEVIEKRINKENSKTSERTTEHDILMLFAYNNALLYAIQQTSNFSNEFISEFNQYLYQKSGDSNSTDIRRLQGIINDIQHKYSSLYKKLDQIKTAAENYLKN